MGYISGKNVKLMKTISKEAYLSVLIETNNSHCGPNLTHEFHNVKLKASAHSLFYPRCAHRWMVELRREAIVKLNRQHPLLKDQGNLVI